MNFPIGNHKNIPEDAKCEQPSRFSQYYTNDPVYVYDVINKLWEKGRIINPTNQPNQYEVMLSNGRTYVRNHIHIKPDKCTQIPSEPTPGVVYNPVSVHDYVDNESAIPSTSQDAPPLAIHEPQRVVTTTPHRETYPTAANPTARENSGISEQPIRKSSRLSQKPKYLCDYVPK